MKFRVAPENPLRQPLLQVSPLSWTYIANEKAMAAYLSCTGNRLVVLYDKSNAQHNHALSVITQQTPCFPAALACHSSVQQTFGDQKGFVCLEVAGGSRQVLRSRVGVGSLVNLVDWISSARGRNFEPLHQ